MALRARPNLVPNGFGIYDMQGNVSEWVEDCLHPTGYEGAPSDGSVWESDGACRERINRGGSWQSDPNYLRVTNRSVMGPTVEDYTIGFRVARTLTP